MSNEQVMPKENASRNAPERRCIVCRSHEEKSVFVRFAVLGGQLCFDLRHKLPGRGYYICAKRACIDRAFAKTIRGIIKHNPSEIGAETADAFVMNILMPGIFKRYREILLAGYQSGQLILGADKTEQAAKNDTLRIYMIASDASESTKEKYIQNAKRKGLVYINTFSSERLSGLFGVSDPKIMGWREGKLGAECLGILETIRRLTQEYELAEAEIPEIIKTVE